MIRTILMITVAGIMPAPNLALVAVAQNPSATTAAPQPAQVMPADADRLLKAMANYIGSAEQFTFHADIIFDHVLPSGQKLQFTASEDVALHRPAGLYIEWDGDLGARQFWYDGQTLTLYDPSTPFYASEQAPADIDAMLDKVLAQLNFSPPLTDFMHHDAYPRVSGRVQFGVDLGTNEVNGQSCQAFAFVEQDIDWQIWINAGAQITPCKLVITYKTRPSQPQFTAVFTDWDFAPRIDSSVFTPNPPQNLIKVPFDTVAASK
jgi:hypothetical protein